MLFKLPRFTTLLLFPIVLGTGVVYTISLVEGNWLCDMCSEIRLLLLAPLGFALIFALLRNNAAISFCSTVLISIICIQTLFGSGHALEKTSDINLKEQPENQISILNYNSEFQNNDKVEALIARCKEKNPDIVLLTKSHKKWAEALETLEYRTTMHILKGPGISVCSKYPSLGAQIFYVGNSKHPQVHIQINKNNQIINLVALHLSAMQTPAGYNDRKAELAALKNRLKEMHYPSIILGNTNCSNWSSTIKTFLSDCNLKDTQDGFMTIPTWPARTGKIIENVPIPPFVAIDNIFVSKGFDVLERKVGPALGADHMPIFVKLQLDMNKNPTLSKSIK